MEVPPRFIVLIRLEQNEATKRLDPGHGELCEGLERLEPLKRAAVVGERSAGIIGTVVIQIWTLEPMKTFIPSRSNWSAGTALVYCPERC